MRKPPEELRGLVEAEVFARHDALGAHTGVGPEDYRYESTTWRCSSTARRRKARRPLPRP
jgi:hypothetical protein